MTTQTSRMNTRGSYIANYEIVGPDGSKIDAGFLLHQEYGISSRMDYSTYNSQGSPSVLSTATFRSIPLNSTIKVNIGLKYSIPMGATGTIRINHIIQIK